ncbi:MAG: ABC transporter ATP-binding protein [Gemmatimonadetes bacterium]|nr:ABC transporter ATP-binding protein [Gemmatimonadota bacterium]
MTTAPLALQVRGLRKRFGDVVAVDGLDLDVAAGECFGLLGPNGAGKTTTLEICEGLQAADDGDLRVLGLTWAADETTLRQRLGVQLQETQYADKLTVIEVVRLFRSFFHDGWSAEETVALVQLEEKRNARIGGLSGGQRQRLSIACALVGNPDLLFLDEPTTGLDPQARRQLWDLVDRLRQMGRTIILTTHYMDEAERLCDRIAIVDRGRVIARGTPRELIRSLGAEQVVEVTVEGEDAVASAAMEALPGVLRARRDAATWTLQVTAAHETLPALLQLASQANVRILELRTHSPTLEDVFVSLTGRALREGESA